MRAELKKQSFSIESQMAGFGLSGFSWLRFVHRAPFATVLAAYGWSKDLTDDEILTRLLALNLERAGKQGD